MSLLTPEYQIEVLKQDRRNLIERVNELEAENKRLILEREQMQKRIVQLEGYLEQRNEWAKGAQS